MSKKNKNDRSPEEIAEAKSRALANLKPAQKGEVKNPYGRWGKAGIEGSFKGMLHRLLFDKSVDGGARAEMLMDVLISKGLEGDIKAIDMILDRVDGKVKDSMKIEVDDGLACIVIPNKKPKEIEEVN